MHFYLTRTFYNDEKFQDEDFTFLSFQTQNNNFSAGINFIYDDQAPEYLLQDDELATLWRLSRSIVSRRFTGRSYPTLTPDTFEAFVQNSNVGIVVYTQGWDTISNTAEGKNNGSLPEVAKIYCYRTVVVVERRENKARRNCEGSENFQWKAKNMR